MAWADCADSLDCGGAGGRGARFGAGGCGGGLELQTIFRLLFDLRDKDAPGYKTLFTGERLRWPIPL